MFIDVVTDDAATGATADYYAEQRAGWGFLPEYVYAFGGRPDVAAAWNTLNGAIRSGMDRRLFELANHRCGSRPAFDRLHGRSFNVPA